MAAFDLTSSLSFPHSFVLPDGMSIPAAHPDTIDSYDSPDKVQDVEQLRSMAEQLVAERHRQHLRELTGPQLLSMIMVYNGWQSEYFQSMVKRAYDDARAQREPAQNSPTPTVTRAPTRPTPARSTGEHRNWQPMTTQLPPEWGGQAWGSARKPEDGPVDLVAPIVGMKRASNQS